MAYISDLYYWPIKLTYIITAQILWFINGRRRTRRSHRQSGCARGESSHEVRPIFSPSHVSMFIQCLALYLYRRTFVFISAWVFCTSHRHGRAKWLAQHCRCNWTKRAVYVCSTCGVAPLLPRHMSCIVSITPSLRALKKLSTLGVLVIHSGVELILFTLIGILGYIKVALLILPPILLFVPSRRPPWGTSVALHRHFSHCIS